VPSRRIEHGALLNLRDLGPLPLRAGGWTVPGHLYRAACFAQIGAADAAWLRSALAIDRVIDLRTGAERARDGDGAELGRAGISVEAISVDEGELGSASWAERPPGFYLARYQRLAGAMAAPLAAVLEAVGRGERVIATCTAGKDRTGVLCALVLGGIGVRERAIAQDYALTGRCLRQHVEVFRSHWERKGLARGQYARRLETTAATMRGLLAWLRETHGGLDHAAAALAPLSTLEAARRVLTGGARAHGGTTAAS
jgi:protein-tyrosine phosphatase